VLLVDHDQAELADRGEDGRARADADARLAAAQALPLVVALARRERRVEHGEAVAEPRPEARHRLRGEADLGHEHDRAAAAGQGRLDRGQVDLGLARAGDAVQQQLARRLRRAVEGGDDLIHGAPLLGEQLGDGGGGVELGAAGTAAQARAARRDQAALLEPAQDPAVGADRRGQLAGRHLAAAQRLEHGPLLGAEARFGGKRLLAGDGDLGAQLGPRPHPLPARPGARREHELQAARRGRAVLGGDPEAEPDELGRRPGLERFERLGEPLRRQLGALGEADDDAQRAPPAPERHAHDAAHLELGHRRRQAVVEGPAQGAGGGQRLDLGDRHAIDGMETGGRRGYPALR
jgi:hypothetical protein